MEPDVDVEPRTGPVDYLMALSESLAAVPVLGKRLTPFGTLVAAGLWVGGRAPGIASAAIKGMFVPRQSTRDEQPSPTTAQVCADALRDIVPAARLDIDWPRPGRLPPVLSYRRNRRRYLWRESVRYGDSSEQVLDFWRRPGPLATSAPVLIFVPGGGWVHGRRALQGDALLSHLAERGWVCLSINYRVSPRNRWPRHLSDVKTAVAWARANADTFGGDSDFVAIAGASAGGHLAALVGLTAGDRSLEADLPAHADTSVDAVVGIYGRYDWEDRSTAERRRFMDFIERVVVRKRHDRHRELFRAASPIARTGPHAPPFLMVHGTADTIIPVAQAAAFADRLRATSQAPVGYLELPGAHHGFDVTDGARTPAAVTAIGIFLDEAHRSYRLGRKRSGTGKHGDQTARRR
ncbi:alpha/beta hydrolase [Mycolicibacter virginiensis]|uniref:Alpha/beta hydrolase n=1 Tax=Mycolicibacter virginiensis TaxID=1795032 RepID=A0A9X7NXG1_9MYCO|nr:MULTISPECIES: alpha/beta hydrolase [Mycobacteriaceae]OBJ32805.1 esterase [Mycolicibacter heraklionensis]PQM50920.1 alpha/beta hydrolase [Mycolicibacter virginiensis]